jgi:diguanylate cyclase (GGDEF)-like protein
MSFYEARLRSAVDDQTVLIARDITSPPQRPGRAEVLRRALRHRRPSRQRWVVRLAFAQRPHFFLPAMEKHLWDSRKPNLKIIPKPGGTAFIPTTRSWCLQSFDHLGRDGHDTLEIQYRIRHRDNGYRWVSTRGVMVRDTSGAPYRVVGSQTDITPRKEAEERLRHEGFHDKVTGLANRALFMDRLTNVIDRIKRQPGYMVAVIYVDLDRFRAVNERLGHDPADRLLEAVAARLRSFARVGDTVARLGDDEFAILLDGIPNDRAAVVFADRMRELIASPCDVGPEEITVTASFGVTLNSPDAGHRRGAFERGRKRHATGQTSRKKLCGTLQPRKLFAARLQTAHRNRIAPCR